MVVGASTALVLLYEQGTAIAAPLFIRAQRIDTGIEFVEPFPFEQKDRDRIRTELTNLALAVSGQRCGWRLAAVLPASATLFGERVSIHGASADLAILLALVSAAMATPLRQDLAMSGGVNTQGQVTMVRGIPIKLGVNANEIRAVLIPDWKADHLFTGLYPQEAAAISVSVKAAPHAVTVVRTVSEAFGVATKEPTIAAAIEPAQERPGHAPPRGPACRVSQQDRALLHRFLERCSDAQLRLTIDAPIEQRLASFAPHGSDAFAAIVEFLTPFFADERARDMEAARLLELATQKLGATAYGIRDLLLHAARSLKEERRRHLVLGLVTQTVDPLDGEQRLALAHACLDEFASLFASTESLAAPEQLANRLDELLLTVVSAQDHLARIFRP